MDKQTLKLKINEYFLTEKNEHDIWYNKASIEVKTFLQKYPIEHINKLPIDEYVEGKGKQSFCWWVERGTQDFGSIQGNTAEKFGIYFSKETNKYECSRKFTENGQDYNQVYSVVLHHIVKLLEDAKAHSLDKIDLNPLSNLFKSKIISLYYPIFYPPLFSKDHLRYFAYKLGIVILKDEQFQENVKLIIQYFKDTLLAKTPLFYIVKFLYWMWPEALKRSKINKYLLMT